MISTQDINLYANKTFEAIQLVFHKHPSLIDFMFEKNRKRLSDFPENLLKKAIAYSSGEYILIQVALDLWSGSGNVNLYDLLTTLDKENFKNVLNALILLRKI